MATLNLTERTKKVVELSTAAGKELGDPSISAWHVALGLVREGEGVAATALQSHGIELRQLAKQLADLGPAERASASGIDSLLSSARAEAEALGHPYTGTEHLLLAVLRESGSPVARIFAAHRFDHSEARARILWILGGDVRDPAPYVPPDRTAS